MSKPYDWAQDALDKGGHLADDVAGMVVTEKIIRQWNDGPYEITIVDRTFHPLDLSFTLTEEDEALD